MNAMIERTTGPAWHDLYSVEDLCIALDYQAARLDKAGETMLGQELRVAGEALKDLNKKLRKTQYLLEETENIVKALTRNRKDPDDEIANHGHEDQDDLFEETP